MPDSSPGPMKKGVVLLIAVALLASGVYLEIETSWLQSRLFSNYARELTYTLEDGPSGSVIFPAAGPFNERQGYTRLAEMTERVAARGFEVERQARFSVPLLEYARMGGNPPYEEKRQSGLAILDDAG